jgi:hypothetical protein
MRSKRLGQVGIGIAVWLAFVLALSLTTLIPTYPYGVLIATAFSLLSTRVSDRILDAVLGKDKEIPDLVLQPLVLTPETPFNRSQFLNMAWASGTVRSENGKVENDIIQNQLNARFGIIRFRNTGDDAIGCRVEVKYLAPIAHSDQKIWIDGGYLSWLSISKRMHLTEMKQLNVFKISELLANPTEDIHREEEKDLQVCYTLQEGNIVILCSETGHPIATYDQGKPANVELELTITAQRYPVTKKTLSITVDGTSIIFQEDN